MSESDPPLTRHKAQHIQNTNMVTVKTCSLKLSSRTSLSSVPVATSIFYTVCDLDQSEFESKCND